MVEKGRVEAVLGAEEKVEETVETAERSVVVTDKRVLAFTPELPGKNFRETDRLNVSAVRPGTQTDWRTAEWAISLAILAVFCVAGGLLVDFGAFAETLTATEEGAQELGLGWIIDAIGTIAWLDVILLPLGVLLGIGAAVLGWRYWQERMPAVVVSVAGKGDDVHIPWPAETEGTMDADAAADQIRTAIAFDEEERWVDEDEQGFDDAE
jgi:hypothetical protein